MSSLDANFVMQKLETLSLENAQLRDRVNYLESIFRKQLLEVVDAEIKVMDKLKYNAWPEGYLYKYDKLEALATALNRMHEKLTSEANQDDRSDN